jgi:hypothetical protein
MRPSLVASACTLDVLVWLNMIAPHALTRQTRFAAPERTLFRQAAVAGATGVLPLSHLRD